MQVKFLNLQSLNDSFGSELIAAANDTIRSGWYLRSHQTEAFEKEWGTYCHSSYAIGVGNGLDALRLVLTAWRIMYHWNEGDEVIVPTNTFIATALAVSQAGLTPVFADVNREDALICTDEQYLTSLLTQRTRCIIPVHLYGQLADIQRIYDFASHHGLQVLEDACQSHGAKLPEKIMLNRTCAYSFYPGKNLGALGDGGCVTTDDGELSSLVRNLANYGQTTRYVHDYQGINSRLDEIQAAILRVKLRRLDADNQRRIQIARYYAENLSNPDQMKFRFDGSHIFHIFPYISANRQKLQNFLTQQDIQTQIHYPIPCHKQHAYYIFNNVSLPNSEYLASHELSLPISPILKDEEAEYVVSKIKSFE